MVVTALAACQKIENDPAPGQRPDERLNQTLQEYKTQLVSAPFGWKAVLFPAGGAAYSFLITFSENDRVTMFSDLNDSTATESFESTYRLKAAQRPSLLFDTYSYLHILADPDAARNGGDYGQGKYSDFEFSFDSATPDQITLTGNAKGSKLVLTKATQADAQNFIRNISENAKAFEAINNFRTYFKRLTVGGGMVDVAVDPNLRNISFSFYDGGLYRTVTTSYYYTEEGIRLVQPLTVGNITITDLKSVQYDEARKRITLTINDVAATIQEATKPIQVDQAAARRFSNLPQEDYLASGTGFTVNGEEDAFKLASIPDYFFLIYWPKYTTSNGRKMDLLGFVLYNQAENRPEIAQMPAAVTPKATNDGRVVFTLQGTFGTDPPPFEQIMQAVYQQWTDPQGYYVVPIGENAFDLVSAKDAKAWIRLEII